MFPRRVATVVVVCLAVLSNPISAQEILTLAEARDLALERSPALRAARAEVAREEGRLVTARTWPYNPEATVESAARSGALESSTDLGFELSQEVEIGGQMGARIRVARSGLEAARQRLVRERLVVLASVEQAFGAVLAARARTELADADLALTRRLFEFEERRLEAGAGTQLEVNVARSAVGRAMRNVEEAWAELVATRASLATVAGIPAGQLPVVEGELAAATTLPRLPLLVERLLETRADLAALRSEVVQRENTVTLARRDVVPNLGLGAFSRSEEGDDIVGGAVSIAIPVFNRNQGEIAVARAEVELAESALARAELEAIEELTSAHAHLAAALSSVRALEQHVVQPLDETLMLLERSLEAGKIDATRVLLLRRELIDGQREAIEALEELWKARATLALAAGAPEILEDQLPLAKLNGERR